eukprot:gene6437-10445_t
MTKSIKIQLHKSFLVKQKWIDQIEKPTKHSKKPFALFQHDVVFNFLSETLYSILEDEDIILSEIRRLFNYFLLDTPFDPATYVIAALYFERLHELVIIDSQNYEKYFCTCILLSCKINEDVYLKNSKFYGFFEDAFESLREFNTLEMNILKALSYDLIITSEEMNTFIIKKSENLHEKIQKGIKNSEQNRKKILQNKC